LDARSPAQAMFSFFASKHVKQGRQFVKDVGKVLAYKRDLWSAAQVGDFEAGIERLKLACGKGDAAGIEGAVKALDEMCGKYLPPQKDAGWRENCEVFLVAIVVALGVRTYFLQPFTIPTGSMWPTLNGIMGYPTAHEPPNAVVQIFDQAIRGRGWLDVVAKDDESIATANEIRRFRFMTYTELVTNRGNAYLVHAPLSIVMKDFHVDSRRTYKKGEPIVRGYVETGDHVFVDKFTYHFRTPRRADVFVFNTQGIAKMGNLGPPPKNPSQFYIKRLAGLPGDELRIDPPVLFINGQRAEGSEFERVMACQDGYRGYSNMANFNDPSGVVLQRPMEFLNTPEAKINVPEKRYWAQGDNSYHSSDSRDWGTVPQENIMGRGVFVYWPFGAHWGVIK
jgi:signal peptidase I